MSKCMFSRCNEWRGVRYGCNNEGCFNLCKRHWDRYIREHPKDKVIFYGTDKAKLARLRYVRDVILRHVDYGIYNGDLVSIKKVPNADFSELLLTTLSGKYKIRIDELELRRLP